MVKIASAVYLERNSWWYGLHSGFCQPFLSRINLLESKSKAGIGIFRCSASPPKHALSGFASDLIAQSSQLLFYHWGYGKSYKVGLLLNALTLDCPYWQLWLKPRKMVFWISLLQYRRHLSQKRTYPTPLKFFPSLPSVLHKCSCTEVGQGGCDANCSLVPQLTCSPATTERKPSGCY